MEQNSIVGMIDEEIDRLRHIQDILQTLLPGEVALAAELQTATVETDAPANGNVKEHAIPAPVRSVSRRGMRTGPRGPRRKENAAPAPRPLDAAIPNAPVVVSRKQMEPAPAASAVADAEAALEAWARSLRPAGASA